MPAREIDRVFQGQPVRRPGRCRPVLDDEVHARGTRGVLVRAPFHRFLKLLRRRPVERRAPAIPRRLGRFRDLHAVPSIHGRAEESEQLRP